VQLIQKIAEADLEIEGKAHNFKTSLVVADNKFNLKNLHGTIDANYINQVSENLGLTFSGAIDARSISVSGTIDKLSLVEGQIYWSGGEIISRTAQAGTQIFGLPPLEGDFSINDENGGIQLDIHQDQKVLIAITLKLDGWVLVDIKSGLFRLAGLSWKGDAGDTAITYEEKIF
jgi:hypothetical protein